MMRMKKELFDHSDFDVEMFVVVFVEVGIVVEIKDFERLVMDYLHVDWVVVFEQQLD